MTWKNEIHLSEREGLLDYRFLKMMKYTQLSDAVCQVIRSLEKDLGDEI